MRISILLSIPLLLLGLGCNSNYTPKPKGYIKFDFPEKEYEKLKNHYPFSFEFPIYSRLKRQNNSGFINLDFAHQNAVLYMSYFSLNDNLQEHLTQSERLAYKHNVIADRIIEQLYINDSLSVYGILYDYEGETAVASQFYLTDSVNHFFRGSLYFNAGVNDSILPVNNFLKYDVKHLIETFYWRYK